MPRKISDKIREAEEEGQVVFSYEYFPPKTEQGTKNLFARLARMAKTEPLYIDVTWGAGGSTSDLTLEICKNAQSELGLETNMHLTCTNMPRELIDKALTEAKEAGICNLLALRGDPPHGQQEWEAVDGGFSYATDLVRYIREQHGDFFCIAVAGYPEGHPNCVSYEEDLKHLKEKVDAGADLIVTQLFYDVALFLKFVDDCRALGITIPIVPGIMPIQTYNGFQKMTSFCKTHVPQAVRDALEPIKHDDALVKAYGIELGIAMCKELVAHGVKVLHMYSLNLEKSVTSILGGLGLLDETHLRKRLPWRQSTAKGRENETVRPIFWSLRPNSYTARTLEWDEYPNGRWGDSRSPAFGSLRSYHLYHESVKPQVRRSMWGEAPESTADLATTFTRFLRGEITHLPWSEEPMEGTGSVPIVEKLLHLNENGFLTINSQPACNAARSDDPKWGWGGPGGRVYQKAYLEFFCSDAQLNALMDVVDKSFASISVHALNARGDSRSVHLKSEDYVSAVTWGVFPGREILQPTVVESESFKVWKEEAFALWMSRWGALYPAGSPSAELIQRVHDTYWLVHVVDDDFIDGDIFAPFEPVIAKPLQ